jgi:hypothetical protein
LIDDSYLIKCHTSDLDHLASMFDPLAIFT